MFSTGKFIPRLILIQLMAAILVVPANAPKPGRRVLSRGAKRAPIQILSDHNDGKVESTNWSGYALLGQNITDAKGSWIVPAVTCSETGKNDYGSFWVGIDGYSSSTVEQTGTNSDCSNGKPRYYAWFEFYPHPLYSIEDFPVSPGDRISAEVSYNATTTMFKVHLQNDTSGQSFSISSAVPNAERNSAEWIAEAPSDASGILPLSDFGSVFYGQDFTGISNTCTAAVNGTAGFIGAFGKVRAITMEKNDGTVKAAPSALSPDGSSFIVTRE